MKNLKVFLLVIAMLVTLVCTSQEKKVTGIVSDASGLLPGATIIVKGTTKGTSTNFDGAYTISVEEGQTLEFIFIGYQPRSLKVGNDTIINVTLKNEWDRTPHIPHINNILKVIEPVSNSKLKVQSSGCQYIDDVIYINNNSYVVYENCTRQKIFYPDMKTFRFPEDDDTNFFALDKHGIYFQGSIIKTDTTGFEIVDINDDDENPEVLWKTKNAIYKNTKRINVSDVATFQAVDYSNGYFKDKNYVYYLGKKIKNSDGATVQQSFSEFVYDKNNVYLNGEIVTYDNEKVIPVNGILYKTTKYVLTWDNKNFTVHPNIDANTLRGLSKSYSIDKNNAYFGINVLPVKKEDLQDVKVWEQENSFYLSDGQKVYYRDYGFENNFDAKTFGVLPVKVSVSPHFDFCFDKNGIYKTQWAGNNTSGGQIYIKLPFHYNTPVTENNTFLTYTTLYVIYENQAYNWSENKLYENLTPEQITLAKANKLYLGNYNTNVVKMDKEFDYNLYKLNNKIYWDGKETIADARTFSDVNGTFYRDAKNVYMNSREGLLTIQGMDSQTIEMFNRFLKDKKFLYYDYHKIIKSKDIELLGIFTGYKMQCSQDSTPSSNFYLFKNFEGYWLVQISDVVTIRSLGNVLPDQSEWNRNLKDELE